MQKNLSDNATTQKINDNVIEFRTKQRKSGIIWVSDAHFDSSKCEIGFLHSVLKKYPDDYIVIGGDSIDVMQGRNDKRAMKGGKFNRPDYFNEVAEYVKNEIRDKYENRIIAWLRGNHDNSIIRMQEIDLIKHIAGDTPTGDTSGYIVVGLERAKGYYARTVIYYSHIPISGGSRSKGMLSVDIIRGKYPDASVYISEHIHNSWVHPEHKEKFLMQSLRPVQELQWFVQNTTLKDEFKGDRNHFYHEKIKAGPQVVGVIRLTFELSHSKNQNETKNVMVNMPEIIVKRD